MKLSKEAYKKGLVIIKENYNLKDYAENVILTWYVTLENEVSDIEYEHCIRIIIRTTPNWYQAGESLASRVLVVRSQAIQELRSEREWLEATAKPKTLEMSDKERRANIKRGTKMMGEMTRRLSLPRLAGETKDERFKRVENELKEEVDGFRR